MNTERKITWIDLTKTIPYKFILPSSLF